MMKIDVAAFGEQIGMGIWGQHYYMSIEEARQLSLDLIKAINEVEEKKQ